jgi:hypothetical protein
MYANLPSILHFHRQCVDKANQIGEVNMLSSTRGSEYETSLRHIALWELLIINIHFI